MGGIKIRILIVDDDNTCLKILSENLERMNHHVVTMNNPIDALYTLQMNYNSYDLILIDVHMPQMNGLDLLRHVKEKSDLPAVLMSADRDKNIMRKGLEDGALFYLVKPVAKESLAKLWQFTVTATRTPQTHRNSFDGFVGVIQKGNNLDNHKNNLEYSILPSSVEARHKVDTVAPNKMILKRTSPVIDREKDTYKKPKLIWTTSLHNIFLEAVHKLGLKKAVPKKIMELMNIPGLRRENVASHLQKYRIFLKRISETSNFTEDGIPTKANDRPLRSSFILNEITYLTNNFQQQYQELLTSGRKEKNVGVGSKTHPKQVPTNVNNHAIGKTQPVPSNYVGLRISSNGELIGTIRDMMTTDYNINNNNNNNNNNNTGGANYSSVDNNNLSRDNGQMPSFEIDDFILNEPINDETLPDAPQGVISNNNEDIFGADFDFGSFDELAGNFESFDLLDQGNNFLNDDDDDTFFFENFYGQPFVQSSCGNSTLQDGDFTKED